MTKAILCSNTHTDLTRIPAGRSKVWAGFDAQNHAYANVPLLEDRTRKQLGFHSAHAWREINRALASPEAREAHTVMIHWVNKAACQMFYTTLHYG